MFHTQTLIDGTSSPLLVGRVPADRAAAGGCRGGGRLGGAGEGGVGLAGWERPAEDVEAEALEVQDVGRTAGRCGWGAQLQRLEAEAEHALDRQQLAERSDARQLQPDVDLGTAVAARAPRQRDGDD